MTRQDLEQKIMRWCVDYTRDLMLDNENIIGIACDELDVTEGQLFDIMESLSPENVDE